jgi:hypothetical protein
MRVVLLCDGMDWCDASAELLVEPDGADVANDMRAYPGWQKCGQGLREWLMDTRGYREPAPYEAVRVWRP